MRTTRITIVHIAEQVPRTDHDLNDELQYLGGSLGLFNPRDKDKTRFRIFIALIKALRTPKRGLTSDEMATQLDLTRATVLHHLGTLADAGIVESDRGVFRLRVECLEELVRRIRDDVDRTLEELEAVARHCDRELGLNAPRVPGKNKTPF